MSQLSDQVDTADVLDFPGENTAKTFICGVKILQTLCILSSCFWVSLHLESRKTALFVAINEGRVRDYCRPPAKTVADEGGDAPAGHADQLTASPCA